MAKEMEENAIKAVTVVQSMIDRTVHDVCYVDDNSNEGDIMNSYTDLSTEMHKMEKKLLADVAVTISSALDLFGDSKSLVKGALGLATTATLADVDLLAVKIKTMLQLLKGKFAHRSGKEDF